MGSFLIIAFRQKSYFYFSCSCLKRENEIKLFDMKCPVGALIAPIQGTVGVRGEVGEGGSESITGLNRGHHFCRAESIFA